MSVQGRMGDATTPREESAMNDATTPPGLALRDPRYQDLCTFFKTMPDGEGWEPNIGDWVVRRPGEGLGVTIGKGGSSLRVARAEGGARYVDGRAKRTCLPTHDQLRAMRLAALMTTGC